MKNKEYYIRLGEAVERLEEKNCPTDPSKWSYYKSQAKKKFDVYPSAYANGWASKQYGDAGGGWKKCASEATDAQETEFHTQLDKLVHKTFGKSPEEKMNEKFDRTHLGILKYAYKDIDKINPSDPMYVRVAQMLDKLSKQELQQLIDADIKFISLLAKNRLSKKESVNESHFQVGDKVKMSHGGVGVVKSLDKEDGGDTEKYYNIELPNGKVMKHAPNELTLAETDLKEGLYQDIMRGVKKGDSPFTLVVIKNNKVVKQVEVKTPQAIPANYSSLLKEFPNSRIRIEDATGKIVMGESINEGIGTIALGVAGGLLLLKVLKFVLKKVVGAVGMNVALPKEKLLEVVNNMVKNVLAQSSGKQINMFEIVALQSYLKDEINVGRITTVKQIIQVIDTVSKKGKNESVNEAISRDAAYIHGILQTGQDAAQNFIDDNGLDGEKLSDYVKANRNNIDGYNVKHYISGERGTVGSVPKLRQAFIKKFKKGKSVNESSMSDIDIIAQEAKDFKDFVKEFYKEYKDFPKDRDTIKWLKGVYDNRSTNESVVNESSVEIGDIVFFPPANSVATVIDRFGRSVTVKLANGKKVKTVVDKIKLLAQDGVNQYRAIAAAQYNVNKKFGSKYDIGAGSMGNGTTFWNRAEEEFGEYKKLAHVSNDGTVKFYDKSLPSNVKKHIEDYAKTKKESVNEHKDCGCGCKGTTIGGCNTSLTEGQLNEWRAEEVLQQLGGRRFIAMTGAKNFVKNDKDKSIVFRVPKAKNSINTIRITLTSMDLYNVEFISVRGTNIKTVATEKGVYNDQLQKIFTKYTGLYTSL